MFKDLLCERFYIVRNNSMRCENNIVEEKEVIYGPYFCRRGRPTSKLVQSFPQNKVIQNFRLYTTLDAEVKLGDIVNIDEENYIVKNIYIPHNHHIECDLIIKKEL